MLWTATAAAVISTLALTLFAFSFPTDLIAYALAVVVGITNAILWIMWGELHSRTKTSFSVKEPQAFLPSHPPPFRRPPHPFRRKRFAKRMPFMLHQEDFSPIVAQIASFPTLREASEHHLSKSTTCNAMNEKRGMLQTQRIHEIKPAALAVISENSQPEPRNPMKLPLAA